MADIFDTLDGSSGGGDIFDQIEVQPSVRPGDVEGRKRQLASQVPAENKAREDVGFLNELFGGLGQAATGLKRAVTESTPILPEDTSASAILNRPLIQAGLGAARVIASPLAPLTNFITRGSEKAADVVGNLTGSDTAASIVGGLTSAAGDVLAPMGLSKVAGAVKPYVKQAFKSGRQLAADAEINAVNAAKAAEEKAASSIAAANEKAAADSAAAKAAAKKNIDEAQQLRDVGVAESRAGLRSANSELDTLAAKTESDLANIDANTKAAQESYQSFGEAAKRNLPDQQTLKTIAGDVPAEEVGQAFKGRYAEKLAAEKARFNDIYENQILRPAEGLSSDASNYKEALGKVLGEGGVSRPLATPAERAAFRAKDALTVSEEAADQTEALVSQIKSASSPAEKRLAEDALHEYMRGAGVPDNPSVRDLILEQKRLRAGERAAQAAQNDNVARQFGELAKAAGEDIKAAGGSGLMEQLNATDAAYARDYVPYFSKKSVTRAIAEGSPERVAADIIRPNSDRKALEKVTRAYELIGDPAQQKAVAQAHLNGLIDEAAKSDDFAKAFVSQWQKYTNPSGNGNKVLRTAYGSDYESVNSVVNSFKNAKPKSIDEVVAKMVKGAEATGEAAKGSVLDAVAPRQKELQAAIKAAPAGIEDVISGTRSEVSALRRGEAKQLRDIESTRSSAVSFAEKQRDIETKLLQKELKAKVDKLVGKPVTDQGGKFIGQLYITKGAMELPVSREAALTDVVRGGVLIATRKLVTTMMDAKRGRELWKAAVRATPGTTQAAANARLILNYVKAAEASSGD